MFLLIKFDLKNSGNQKSAQNTQTIKKLKAKY